jgi:glyoxylase I family protein
MKTLVRLFLVLTIVGAVQTLCARQTPVTFASFIPKDETPMTPLSGATGQAQIERIRPEHVAFNVLDPSVVVRWYCDNLGMKVMRQGGAPTFTTFIADSGEHMMLELFHNADFPLFEPGKFNHMSIHLAFMVQDIAAMKTNLLKARASVVDDITKTPSGDQVLMMRDPWGLAIQFVQRAKPMFKTAGVRPEHLALNVSDSRKTARWFVENLGMKVMREGGAPAFGMFVADSSEQVMLELYQNADYPVIEFTKISHMSIHFASMVSDVSSEKQRLLKAGASLAEDVTLTPAGDKVLMLRDPAGFPIQFVHRAAPMLK